MFGWIRSSKSQGRLSIDGTAMSAPARRGQTILQAAVDARIKFPHMCNVGECGTCRCRLIEGHVRLKRDITNHVSLEELEQGFVLGCQAVIEGDVLVEVPGLSPNAGGTTNTAGTIAQMLPLTHDITEVRVALAEAVSYQAGQYARLAVRGVAALEDVARNYSFARASQGETREVSFFIRHVPGGAFTDWLFGADRTGAALELTAPFGDFRHHPAERPMLLIAGGSGLAPIKAVLESCAAEGLIQPVTVLFGARTRADLYALDQIDALAARWPASFAFHPILSNEPDSSGWSGRRGFVTEHLDRLVPNLEDHDLYMCGPPPMIDSLVESIGDRIPASRRHFDRFFDQGSLSALDQAA
jgi:toluene methyl-monooxygenase electron transfer component